MSKKEKVKRYITLMIGLMVNATGVALQTKSGLGASPMAAIPFAMSLSLPVLTIGQWMFFLNLIIIAIQVVMLKKEMGRRNLLLQLLFSLTYSFLTDAACMVFSFVNPTVYISKVICLALACICFGFGVNFELTANLSMLPGNALPKVIANRINKEYGPIKVINDVTMTVISGIISWLCLGSLISVREGTVASAVLIGTMVKLVSKVFNKMYSFFRDWINR